MNRDEMLARLESKNEAWDFIIIGGGATGVGIAIDGASRGYNVLLLEQSDFGKGTSSRSTKLIHGGVRYLQQGNISLVLEALKERGLLLQNAPHLVHNLPFIVPNYSWWEAPFYGVGLKLYDALAGKYGFGDSKILSVAETTRHIPTLETEGLRGGIIYYDGQFDDARLIINMAQTADEQGAVLINYVKAIAIEKNDGMVSGVVAADMETGREYHLEAKAVINAAGVFSDFVRAMDDADFTPMIVPSQGIHIILDRSFLPGDSAIMVPHTEDGRVLFAIPWHNRVIVGTTDTPVDDISLEPIPMEDEISFLLDHASKYLIKDPARADVKSAFAGLRPLVSSADENDTAKISRDHGIHISRSGLITIAGGKWTTYRKMAEDTVDQAYVIAQLEPVPCSTRDLQIHGYHRHSDKFGDLSYYGADAVRIENLLAGEESYRELLHPELPTKAGEVVWAARHEMARTVDDFLSRRTRVLLLDVKLSIEIAPKVATLLADELGRGKSWVKEQVAVFNRLAEGYMVASIPPST